MHSTQPHSPQQLHSLQKHVGFDAKHQHQQQQQKQQLQPEVLNNIDAADEDDIPAEAYY